MNIKKTGLVGNNRFRLRPLRGRKLGSGFDRLSLRHELPWPLPEWRGIITGEQNMGVK